MAYYLTDDIEKSIDGLKSKISILCSIYGCLDYWKKIVLLMYISEYATLKNKECGSEQGDMLYIRHTNVMNLYPMDMHKTVSIVFRARDLVCHAPDTSQQIKLWDRAWDEGHVRKLLEFEGFL